jgi:formate dehydrogenase major subunit
VRTGFGTNNVDHCTRLCHASSVAALFEMIGSAAVSNPVRDAAKAEVILVIGSHTTANHPVAASFLKNEAAAANLLTNEALDPAANIPEFKFCAIQVTTPDRVFS